MLHLLNDEERRLQQAAREFADRDIAPQADAMSREGRFPAALLRRAAELGFLGMLVPKELGGQGQGNFALALVLEEINRACASVGVTVSVHNSLATSPILRFGSEALRRKYLPLLARGEQLGAYCLTEPQAGSDAAALVTAAVRDGDTYVLNGTKLFVTTGAEAGLYIVFARTDTAHKTRGITAFVVERASPGVSVGKVEVKLGLRASHTVEILLQDCRVPAANVLGEVGEGFKIAMHTLDGGRIGIATQSLGIAQACLDAAARFALAREQGGEPVARSQIVEQKLAVMATEIEAARLLTYSAARLRDQGQPCAKEASMAKLFASQTCNRAAREALQVHGTYGYLEDFPAERFFRDARVTELYEGTTEIQKMVIARHVLKQYAG